MTRRVVRLALVPLAVGGIVIMVLASLRQGDPPQHLSQAAGGALPVPSAGRAPAETGPTPTTSATSTATTPVPPPPSHQGLATAGLPPSAPVRVEVPAVGISAPVDPLGLNPDRTLEVPEEFDRAGYYTGRPTPGEVGPAIIVGHVDSKRGPAAFYRLRRIKPGDEIAITRADGTRVVFVADRVERHRKDAFPTEAVYGPTAGPALRLITCGGEFNRTTGHYRDNTIVFAHP